MRNIYRSLKLGISNLILTFKRLQSGRCECELDNIQIDVSMKKDGRFEYVVIMLTCQKCGKSQAQERLTDCKFD